MLRYVFWLVVLISVCSDLSFASYLVKRDPIPLDVPISGTLTNTTTNYDPITWTLWNPIFNQTTWESQPYVSNGYIGHRIPAEGMGYWQANPETVNTGNASNGWPLFSPRMASAMIAQFYDQQPNTTGTNFAQTGGEQPISTLPVWTSLYVTVNGTTFLPNVDSGGVSSYSQNLSIRHAMVSTSMVWQGLQLNYTILAHRTRPTLGVVRLELTPLDGPVQVVITDMLDGAGSWRTTFNNSASNPAIQQLITSVKPDGISNITAVECSLLNIMYTNGITPNLTHVSGYNITANSSTISQGYQFNLSSPAVIMKYVGIASTDAFSDPLGTAQNTSSQALSEGWNAVLNDHVQGWEALWTSADIEVLDDQEVQLSARSALFHLWSNVRSGYEQPGIGDTSIAPSGLTSDSYAGQIFWDADTFMFPGLLVLSPDFGLSITNFRYKKLGAALQNAPQYNLSGALYPWTGARFGNCTGVGPCYEYEYHINNDIALAQWQYYEATGNVTWLREYGYPVISAVANMWVSLVQKVPSTTSDTYTYQTFNLTDPDEFANNENNGAYTNAGIKVIMAAALSAAQILNVPVNATWVDVGNYIDVPVDPNSGIILEYTGFNGTTPVKQADVVLLTYPLEYPQDEPLENLDYYAIHTSPNGPAMTYSNFAIDSAALSTQGCATWSYLLAGSAPYLRLPFYQFSEEAIDYYALNGGTNPAYAFLTGHGGFLQVFTHGLTGYRFRPDVFYLNPVLPPQLAPNGVIIHGMKWQGAVFDVQIASVNTTITRLPGSANNVNNVTVQIAPPNPMAGLYPLAVNGSIVVPTRRPDTNVTVVAGNLAQCKPIIASNQTTFPGQYPVAAIDSSNGTAWQPSSPSPAYIVVDLESQQPLTGVHINWGDAPAQSFQIQVSNDSVSYTSVLQQGVQISEPYNETLAVAVEIQPGNTTNAQFNATARYVQLVINGTWGDQTVGATVAEFAIL